ncbi:Pup--protein ligase [Corynebacterium sp. 4HC-13]|uniref:Pup--protein ligase n=1 Tax=Corynebacterium anserum TaxID=2684406 RepID=UPI001639ADD6|nr:Pup--protein ligase [Corynebacterium anserum]MBC2681542.1 Pup--protein ligase [Corynebacterium anserum]
MGLETEYGITNILDSTRRLGPDEIARELFEPITREFRSSNIYTNNASRLYLDVGAHPEIATAECDSLHQLIAYDRAGDLTLHRMALEAEQRLEQRGIGGHVFLLKNNTDTLGNSYGCHENYLIGRDVPLKALSAQLLPFLITRQLIAGAGKLSMPSAGAPNENFEPGFVMSQRADHVWEGVSSATTRSRPIINTRDEPHADSSRYRRLHIIVGDSNMSEVTTALKVGSTLLVLELIEAGWDLPDYEMANEIRSIRDIARDFTATVPIKLRNAQEATPLEIQRSFCEASKQWLSQRPDPPADEVGFRGTPNSQLEPVVELWERTLNCFDTGDFTPVATEIDWVIKKTLMDRIAARNNLDATDPRLVQVDLTYHDIHPDRGLFNVLVKRGFAQRLIEPGVSEQAITEPPATTRAALRGHFLKKARATDTSITVDWMRLKINGEHGMETVLADPFSEVDERVDSMIALMETGCAP